jgi:hypothetical protein
VNGGLRLIVSAEVEIRQDTELLHPLTHIVLAGELQALCGIWVGDEITEDLHGPRCQVCLDLGKKYLTWHTEDVTW